MIPTLAIALFLALVLGIIAQRLRLSPLVGYLAAGIVASFCAHLIDGITIDAKMVAEFSHVGVILLLFGVGLQFHFKDLLAVQKVAVPGALCCIVVTTCLGTLAYWLFGGEVTQGFSYVMYGLCICVSSTVVLTRVLTDNKVIHTPTGHTALGWLVVEDIFTIMLLVLLPAIIRMADGAAEGSGPGLLETLGLMVLKLSVLVALVVVIGRWVVPRVLGYVSRSTSSDLFTLTVLVMALGIAVLAAYGFNASMEFGAFLSGMVVGQSRFSARAASEALPMRDAFAVLFFVSVGMGFEWSGLIEYWPLALATLGISLLIKPLMAYFVIRLLQKPSRMAVGVAASLSQIGEFSFILASLAAGTYGLLPLSAANVITGVAIITITINSVAYRYVPYLCNALEKRGIGVLRQRGKLQHIPAPSEDMHRIIVVGYGPCGQLVTRILLNNNMDVVVLEMNIDTVNQLAKEGIPAILGDARLQSILRMAGVEASQAIIVTAPAAPAQEIAEAARAVKPDIEVMAHTSYLRNAHHLRKDGAHTVFSGEEEVALTMASFLLRSFGATEEQVSQERRAVRKLLAVQAAASRKH